MTKRIADLSVEQLREVVEIKEKIALLETKLSRRVGDGKTARNNPGKKKKRKMSAAARKRIADAQKKRWAKQKKKAT